MPHTTTKSVRSKRPDTRPNAKQRLKMQQKFEKDSSAQDLRIVRKNKAEKKARECQTLQPLRKINKKGETEKYIGSLKKKLRAIGIHSTCQFLPFSIPTILILLCHVDELLSKQRNGVELDEQQLQKVDKLPEVMEQLQNAMKEATNVDLDIV